MTKRSKILITPVVAATLIVAVLCAAAFVPASATSPTTAKRQHFYEIGGSFVDPGAAVSNVSPDGDRYRFDLTGGTHWAGDLTGDTAYTGFGWIDGPPPALVHGVVREKFTGSLAGVGSGHLTCIDAITNNPDNSGHVNCSVDGGDGVFRRAKGELVFPYGVPAADGSLSGPITGFLILVT